MTLPPMGAAKQQPTPTAQAAASISMFLASFCGRAGGERALSPPPPTPGAANPAGGGTGGAPQGQPSLLTS